MTQNVDISGMLNRVQDYANRMATEEPYAMFEMQGRLMGIYGVICKTAAEVYEMERVSRRTLLDPKSINIKRKISQLKGLLETLKGILNDVPLFKYRDYDSYQKITTFDEILRVKEQFEQLEQLPHSKKGMVKDVNFNATEFAYKMYDIIFLGLEGMILLFQRMLDDQKMLEANPELRLQRLQVMADDLRPSDLSADTPTSNFLSDQELSDYIFDNRNNLSREQVNAYIRQYISKKQQELQTSLADLRQPAHGIYADLFTSRAAHELAKCLVPTIARNVDFRHKYHYVAWAMAMRDLGLIRTDRRNGLPLMHFINKHFLKGSGQIQDQNLLTQWLRKLLSQKFGHLTPDNLSKTCLTEAGFLKLKDTYWHCLTIINQVLQKDLHALSFAPDFCQPHPNSQLEPVDKKSLHLLVSSLS